MNGSVSTYIYKDTFACVKPQNKIRTEVVEEPEEEVETAVEPTEEVIDTPITPEVETVVETSAIVEEPEEEVETAVEPTETVDTNVKANKEDKTPRRGRAKKA